MQKIVITGANGFLGQHLTLQLAMAGYQVIATGKGNCRIYTPGNFQYFPLDLTDDLAIENFLQLHQPDVIIHNAALSKPDECETNKTLCLQVNVKATRSLLQHSSGKHFIYLSTDFVFGENGPHAEDDEKAPLNFYGESKLQAEQLVDSSGVKATIVRPVFIYGPQLAGMKPSFVQWVRHSLEQGKTIRVVSDQRRTPTFVYDICRGMLAIVQKEAPGTYHFAGKNILSPYEMAVKTAGLLHLDATLIHPVTSESFPEPVTRAKRSGLTFARAAHELNYNPVDFEEGLKATFF